MSSLANKWGWRPVYLSPPSLGNHHGGFCSSVLDTDPRGVGGVQEGGGSRKIFSVLGAFLNSPFHSEHFECTQVG